MKSIVRLMKKTKKYFSHLFITLSFTLAPIVNAMADEEITIKGFRLPDHSIEKDFTLMSLTPSTADIERYIKKTNFRIDEKTRHDIAKNVLKVSECLKIDPWILTGLIKKESTFNPFAISPTKAAGLTQFTGIGILEVNDQLGMRGEKYATSESIEYFTTVVRECINPAFVHLWDRVAVKADDPSFVDLAKKEIMNDVELAVTYGGILLKTYLAYTDLRTDTKLSQTYFKALQTYNGEPGEAKVKYAKAIFKNLEDFYPRDVNFQF